tara:strand:+ start:1309 stop:1593 length:285 start_codon:yes stop_codon:yes gene_type:complete
MNTTLKRIEDELARQNLENITPEQAAAYMLEPWQNLDDLGRLGRYPFRAAVGIAGADVIFAGFSAAADKAVKMGLSKPASPAQADGAAAPGGGQ